MINTGNDFLKYGNYSHKVKALACHYMTGTFPFLIIQISSLSRPTPTPPCQSILIAIDGAYMTKKYNVIKSHNFQVAQSCSC